MLKLTSQQLIIIKNILKQHVPECEIRIFGSRINGKARPYSDLDLAIIGKDKLPLRTRRQLQENFENSELPFRVEILDWHSISDEFRNVITKQYSTLNLF